VHVDAPLPPGSQAAETPPIRRAGAAVLAQALQDSRADTLATFADYQAALGPSLRVPRQAGLNPPLWELGHIGWFQELWVGRNPQRHHGTRADPESPRQHTPRPAADALYDSSRVAHASRWQLDLPDAAATQAVLAQQLQDTLQALAGASVEVFGGNSSDNTRANTRANTRDNSSDDALYFFRLALFHEDMHHEASLYMARALGIPVTRSGWHAPVLSGACVDLAFEATEVALGVSGPGFAFDNERPAHRQPLAAFAIDSRVRSWAEFMPFVEAGGYRDPRFWSDAGREWLLRVKPQAPRYLRRDGEQWIQLSARGDQVLDLRQAAEHLTAHEAEAWCRWSGRRLPTEAEWEPAAAAAAGRFDWGAVWEWTDSRFLPYEGFEAHPYRDYSQPWFDGRPVLRGASYLTQPRMHDRRYRNFFEAGRNDVVAGLRSCAVGP
jgi:gamma-glutamyl hercynylcysteine S-oxide synthase